MTRRRGGNPFSRKKLTRLAVAAVIAGVGAWLGPKELLRPSGDQAGPAVQEQREPRRSAAPVQGEISGRVVKVSDGDTITVLVPGNQQVKVRMLGIDAPEKSQPFGEKCRENLAGMIAGKEVRVETGKPDRYGRTIGKILFEGRDVNLAQVEVGCAWHYKQYSRNQQATDRSLYASKEVEAREAGRGLWRDREPEAPWAFRQESREAGGRKRRSSASEQ